MAPNILPSFGGNILTTGIIATGTAIIILLIVGYYGWRYWNQLGYKLGWKKYPVKTTIWQVFGDSYKVKEDRAVTITDDEQGKATLKFLSSNQETDPIPRKYIYPADDGNYHLSLVETDRNEYAPLDPDVDEGGLKVGQKKWDSWIMHRVRKEEEYWKNENDKWWKSDMAKWAGVGMFFLLVFIGTGYYITRVNQSVTEAIRAVQFAPLAFTLSRGERDG